MVHDHRRSGMHRRTRSEPMTMVPVLFGISAELETSRKAVEILRSQHCVSELTVPKGRALCANVQVSGSFPARAAPLSLSSNFFDFCLKCSLNIGWWISMRISAISGLS